MSAVRVHVSFSQSNTCVWTIPSSCWSLLPPATNRLPFVIWARPLQKMLKPSLRVTFVWLPVVGSQTVASVLFCSGYDSVALVPTDAYASTFPFGRRVALTATTGHSTTGPH